MTTKRQEQTVEEWAIYCGNVRLKRTYRSKPTAEDQLRKLKRSVPDAPLRLAQLSSDDQCTKDS